MLTTILKYAQGQPQPIIEWTRYVNVIELRTSVYVTRFLAGAFYYSPFVNLINHVLHDVDISNILKSKSDFTRYQEIYNIANTYRDMIDPLYLSRNYGRVFTLGGTPDYVLNVMRSIPLGTLPLDQPWSAWTSVKPVRIIHHDALELVSNFHNFSIEFKGPAPTRLIGSIDLILLIFKYAKYVEMCRQHQLDDNVETFIHQQLMPVWFSDLRSIWLFNLLNDVIFSEQLNPTKYTMDNIISPVSALLTIRPDIIRILKEIRDKNLTIGEFLAMPWLGVGCSLTQWLRTLVDQLQPPVLNQYLPYRFLEEIPYASFVMRLNNLIGTRQSTNLNRELYQRLVRYHNSNIYVSIHDPNLRQRLVSEVGQLMTTAKMYQQR